MTARHRLSRKGVAALPVRSEAEETLAGQLRMLKILHLREFAFAHPRRYRADFAFLSTSLSDLLVEVDGGGWVQGHHSRGQGIEDDCEKSALAAINGYRVIHVTPKQIESGRALAWIEAALGRKAA